LEMSGRLVVLSTFVLCVLTTVNINTFNGVRRFMTLNLGDGNCEWTLPIDDSTLNNPGEVQATLIVGFPGVGKRLVWGMVEQLTNRRIGDDWNLSDLGDNLVAMKTSYPHPEGNWTWEDRMHHSVMVIRNPMQTLIDYHNIREEIKPAQNVEDMKRLNKTDEVFTKESDLSHWFVWRDAAFDNEMDLYGWFIEYWMDNGRRRNNGTGEVYYESSCTDLMVGGCTPKAIIQYEALMDEERGEDEVVKLASVLVDSAGVPVIDQSVWSCTYHEVMKKDSFYSAKKRGASSGVQKKFSYKQLAAMKREVERLRDKYTLPIYESVPSASQLVLVLEEYLVDISDEFQKAWKLHEQAIA